MSEGLQKALKTAMVTGSTAEAATLHDGSLTSHDKEILLTITTGELEALKKLEMDARLKNMQSRTTLIPVFPTLGLMNCGT